MIFLSASTLVFILSEFIRAEQNGTDLFLIPKNCRERNRLINAEKGDLYALIDVTIGDKLILLCHYCKESDDFRPKRWFKQNKLRNDQPKEIEFGMDNNATRNRITVNPDHSLVINNFTSTDIGLYYCKRLESGEEDEKYNYLVELVSKEIPVAVETGNETDWHKYSDDYFLPINQLFKESHGTEFKYLRETLHLQLELITQWDPYGICEICGRPKNEGIKRQTGHCRIKISQQGNVNITSLNDDEAFISLAYAVSCRSLILSRIFPGISNSTKVIPDFIQHIKCDGICNPDAEGTNAGWKRGKTKSFKYRKIAVLYENDHITFVCPESTLDNIVLWKRNGKELKRGQGINLEDEKAEPRILVDTFNTLYLVNVKQSEEGNYTCEVDTIRMQQIVIFVVAKSYLLTYEFIRHLAYLGVVLSLTITCYCAGCIITCSRRDTFKGYKELKEIHAKEDRAEYV